MRIVFINMSDRCYRGEAVDLSGDKAVQLMQEAGFPITERHTLPDEKSMLEELLIRLCDEGADLILTSGGTGLSPRDITPEATLAVADRQIPGICEAMRAEGLKHKPSAMLSRAVAVQRGKTVIVNLPGSTKAVEENLGVLIPALDHMFHMVSGEGHSHEAYLKR